MVITKENKKKKKDAAIGFGVITVIIVVIVGVIVGVLPEEPKTTQNELEENELIITDPKLDFETKKDLTKELLKKTDEFELSSEKELDVVADAFVSIDEYRKTNKILEGYSTVEILVDILDDENGKITELDRRIEYHSTTEPRDGFDMEWLFFVSESIEQQVTVCKDSIYQHTLEHVLPGLGVQLQYLIKDGYAKDPSVTPTLNKIAKALYAYKECAS